VEPVDILLVIVGIVIVAVVGFIIVAAISTIGGPPREPYQYECVWRDVNRDGYAYYPIRREIMKVEKRADGEYLVPYYECIPGSYPTVAEATIAWEEAKRVKAEAEYRQQVAERSAGKIP
jgi:hypothetical protein